MDDIKIEKVTVSPRARQLSAKWTIEPVQELICMYSGVSRWVSIKNYFRRKFNLPIPECDMGLEEHITAALIKEFEDSTQ